MFWESIVCRIFEAQGVLMSLWPLKERPPHCVDTLGTKFPVTQDHIPELIPHYTDKWVGSGISHVEPSSSSTTVLFVGLVEQNTVTRTCFCDSANL
jgi:hypothetical protein